MFVVHDIIEKIYKQFNKSFRFLLIRLLSLINKIYKIPLSGWAPLSEVLGLYDSNTHFEILYSKILLINKTNSTMAELTGLDSILEKSHYKTERKNKYSFGKSQRFSSMKSTYQPYQLGTPMTFLMSHRPGIPGPARSDMAANTSSINHLIIPLALNTIYPRRSIKE